MKILLIDNGSSYLEQLKKWLSPHEIVAEQFNSIDLESAARYDLIVLSGGHSYSVLNHEQEYHNELQLIRNSGTPILGICLGFELIALNSGCQLTRLDKQEKGIVEIKLTPGIPFSEGMDSIKVYESHRWALKNAVPELVSMGTSIDGIELIKHADKLIYGLQFHPEIVVDEQGEKFVKNLVCTLANPI